MPRDLEYERTHRAFDAQCPEEEGGGIQCENYELCRAVLPLWWWDCKGHYECVNCDMTHGRLSFVDSAEACPVCMCVGRQVLLPQCQHALCLACARSIFAPFDESPYELSPVPYGCPPCPNGCAHPAQGPQCGCEEWWEDVLEAWTETSPGDWRRWNDDSEQSVQRGWEAERNRGSALGSSTCPLCRTEQSLIVEAIAVD